MNTEAPNAEEPDFEPLPCNEHETPDEENVTMWERDVPSAPGVPPWGQWTNNPPVFHIQPIDNPDGSPQNRALGGKHIRPEGV